MYALRARYMDPETGMFLSLDTWQGNLSDPSSLHKYTYAQNNPVKYVDPSGHSTNLTEETSATAMNANLQSRSALNVYSIVRKAILNFTIGAVMGGVDTALGGGSWQEVVISGLYGGLVGLSMGTIMTIAVFAAVTIPALTPILIGYECIVVICGGTGCIVSVQEGKVAQAIWRGILTVLVMMGFSKLNKNLKQIKIGVLEDNSNLKNYYHVTTEEHAQKIIATGELKSSKWESRVFAWTEQPTRKQASIAGIGKSAKTVIRFKTNASFELDDGNTSKSIEGIVVQTTDGQRLPISITDIEIVGFKKEW